MRPVKPPSIRKRIINEISHLESEYLECITKEMKRAATEREKEAVTELISRYADDLISVAKMLEPRKASMKESVLDHLPLVARSYPIVATARSILAKVLLESDTPHASGWPSKAAPLEVMNWALKRVPRALNEDLWKAKEQIAKGATPDSVDSITVIAEDGDRRKVPLSYVAMVYSAEKEAIQGARERAIAIPVNKIASSFIEGIGTSAEKNVQRRRTIDGEERWYELFLPGKQMQLCLPIDGSLEESLVRVVQQVFSDRSKTAEFLRNWVALYRQLSIEGGRSGQCTWTMDQHLESMEYKRQRKSEPELRQRIADYMDLLTRFRVSVRKRAQDKKEIELEFPLIVTHAIARERDSEEESFLTNAMSLEINKTLYAGVRDPKTNKIGRMWYPTSKKLSAVNHKTHPYTIPLVLLLSARFREHGPVLHLKGSTLISMAGIKRESYKTSQCLRWVTRDLQQAVDIEAIGSFEWQPSASLSNVCELIAHPKWSDRVVRKLKIVERSASTKVTGSFLKKHRETRGLTQAQAAEIMGVTDRTLRGYEKLGDKPLSAKAISKFDAGEWPAKLPQG